MGVVVMKTKLKVYHEELMDIIEQNKGDIA